jgi:hypothetical protein
MANTKIQFKRTTVSGRLPNTTNSANTQYIDAGEFAVNLADSKVISSNGTVTFEVGANLTTSYISSNVSIGGITLINTTAMSTNNIYTYGTVRVLNQANTAKYQDISVDVNGYINFSTVAISTTLGAGTGYWNLISSLGPLVGNSQVGGYYFSSANNATSGSQDTGIYRIAAGQLTVGNSTKGDTSGSIVLSNLYAGNTAANTVANTTTIKISTNATLYSTINSTAINVGSNTAQFGTAMYVSANGNLTLNGVANLGNTVYGWSKVDTALAVNTYYKIAELPTSSGGTYDHVVVEGLLDDNWNSNNKTEVKILFSNRNAFTYRYYLNGTLQTKSKILAFLEANSAVSIYYATEVAGASYMSASMNITKTVGATVFATPVANTTLPSGTRNFDTANSSYTPLLTIPYSGVPSYSGQNIILANTTTFGGTANNSTYLGGFTWAAPGGVGSGTANTGAFTTLTTTQGNIANTVSATTGQVIAYAVMQGGRSYYAYDMNSYAALYEARFVNSSTSTNIPTGMTGNFYWYGMGAGDTSARGFDLLGTSSSQLWFRERSANTWNQVVTANNAHTLNGVITFAANASFTGNATNRIIVGSTTINATTYSGTSNNSTYLNGQLDTYYTNIAARLGYTPLSTNTATPTVASGLTGSDLTFSIGSGTGPGVGYSTKIIFPRATDSAGIAVTELSSDITLYEFYMSDNPDGGDYYSWRFTDWQGQNGLWIPYYTGGLTNRFSGTQSYFYSSLNQPLINGYFSTGDPLNATTASRNLMYFNDYNKLKLTTHTGTVTISAIDVGAYSGTNGGTIWIKSASATTFDWGYGSSGGAATQTGLGFSTSPVSLSNGITVTFNAATGGVAGEVFQFRAWKPVSNALGPTTITGVANVTSLYIGNSSVYTTTNATNFSGISNNALYLGGTAAAGYQTTAGLSANVLTLSANLATYVGNSSGTIANIASWITGNAATAYTNAVTVAANATNLSNGTVPTARLGSGTANSTTILYGNGVWAAAPGGSGSPGGSNTQLQFNDSAAFGGSSSLTFDKTTVVLSVGNSTVNTTINSTSFSGTSNNSTNFGGSSLATIQSQITGNAATAYTNAAAQAVTAYTNAVTTAAADATSKAATAYSNAVANAAALYQTTAGLSANVLTLSSNSATYVGNSSGTIANIASWITGNSATAYTNAVTVAATDATTKAGTAYTNAIAIAANATNLTSGTISADRIPTTYVNTSAAYTISGVHTHSANILLTSGYMRIGTGTAFDFGSTSQLEVESNANTYGQIVLQNANTGTGASADIAITADNGNNTSNFVNLGINSSTYNDAAFTITGAGDAYLYSANTRLVIGTATVKDIIFHAGGTLAANKVLTVNTTALAIANSVGVLANGSFGTSGQVLTSNATGVYWATPSAGSGTTAGRAYAFSLINGL